MHVSHKISLTSNETNIFSKENQFQYCVSREMMQTLEKTAKNNSKRTNTIHTEYPFGTNHMLHTKWRTHAHTQTHPAKWKRSRKLNHENHSELWTSIWEFIDISRVHCNDQEKQVYRMNATNFPKPKQYSFVNEKNNNKSLWFKASQTLKSKRSQSFIFHSLACDCRSMLVVFGMLVALVRALSFAF